MPYVRRYRRSRAPRRYAKRRPLRRSTKRRRTFRPKISRTLGVGLPARTRTTLKYVDRITLSGNTGTLVTHAFNATSIFDPNSTGGGHQPMYRDQLAALYNHYIVNSSKINVKFCPFDTTNNSSSVVFLRGDDNETLTAPTSMTTQLETRGTKWRHVPIYAENQVVNFSLSTSYYRKKTFKNYKNSDLQAPVNSDPVEEWFFMIGLQSDDQTTTTNMSCWVTIYYDVEFFELKDIQGS